nr:phosphatidylinositol-glycan biosynthesis class X protein isoform X2 [Equus asinus]
MLGSGPGWRPTEPSPQQQPRRTPRRLRRSSPRPRAGRRGAGQRRELTRGWGGCLPRRRNFRGPGLRGTGEPWGRRRARTESSVLVANSVAARCRSGVRRVHAPPRFVPARSCVARVLRRPGCPGRGPPGGRLAAPLGGGWAHTHAPHRLPRRLDRRRDLLIKVKFGESIEDFQTCRLLIKQYIPTGLFVDPYELASLQERNVTEAVMVSENFNIEAPDYLSKESEVLIYARQDSQCIDCFQAFLPVHYRYHRPHSKDGETFIVVNNPDLLMYCDQEFPILKCWAQSKVAAPCALKNKDICQWNNMKYKSFIFIVLTSQLLFSY